MNLKAVLGDLAAMSGAFHGASKEYQGLAPDVSPPVADSGDDALNSSITAMADLIIGLHGKFCDRLDDHGDKISYAHDSFQRNDIDVHGLFEDLMGD